MYSFRKVCGCVCVKSLVDEPKKCQQRARSSSNRWSLRTGCCVLFVGVVVVVAVVTATLTNVSLIINAVFAVVARNLLPFVFSYIHSYILTYTDLHVNMYILCSICAFVDGLRLLLLLRLIWHLTKKFLSGNISASWAA